MYCSTETGNNPIKCDRTTWATYEVFNLSDTTAVSFSIAAWNGGWADTRFVAFLQNLSTRQTLLAPYITTAQMSTASRFQWISSTTSSALSNSTSYTVSTSTGSAVLPTLDSSPSRTVSMQSLQVTPMGTIVPTPPEEGAASFLSKGTIIGISMGGILLIISVIAGYIVSRRLKGHRHHAKQFAVRSLQGTSGFAGTDSTTELTSYIRDVRSTTHIRPTAYSLENLTFTVKRESVV